MLTYYFDLSEVLDRAGYGNYPVEGKIEDAARILGWRFGGKGIYYFGKERVPEAVVSSALGEWIEVLEGALWGWAEDVRRLLKLRFGPGEYLIVVLDPMDEVKEQAVEIGEDVELSGERLIEGKTNGGILGADWVGVDLVLDVEEGVELFILQEKAGVLQEEARKAVLNWRGYFEENWGVLLDGAVLPKLRVLEHRFSVWARARLQDWVR